MKLHVTLSRKSDPKFLTPDLVKRIRDQYLSLSDVISLAGTCKTLRGLLINDNRYWFKMCANYYRHDWTISRAHAHPLTIGCLVKHRHPDDNRYYNCCHRHWGYSTHFNRDANNLLEYIRIRHHSSSNNNNYNYYSRNTILNNLNQVIDSNFLTKECNVNGPSYYNGQAANSIGQNPEQAIQNCQDSLQYCKMNSHWISQVDPEQYDPDDDYYARFLNSKMESRHREKLEKHVNHHRQDMIKKHKAQISKYQREISYMQRRIGEIQNIIKKHESEQSDEEVNLQKLLNRKFTRQERKRRVRRIADLYDAPKIDE